MHPIVSCLRPALGKPCWLVKHGHGSFVTMEFGEPQVEIREPEPGPVRIEGAPERSLRRLAQVHGDWQLWIYCCQWSLSLHGTQIAYDESGDLTMNRALGVLNGQILTGVQIEPGSQTTFWFDLGCSLVTHPAPSGSYGPEPAEQWMWYTRSGPVMTIRGDGTYAISPGTAKPDDYPWLPIATPVNITVET